MRVLLADKLSPAAERALTAAGCTVTVAAGLKDEALAGKLAEVDPAVLIVRSTKVTRAHLLAAPALALVVRAGAGVNTIALDAAAERGIYVANCPGKNAVAVAELTFGLLLALDRRIPDNVADLRAGRWRKGVYEAARGLKGRTLGILGVGDIGREVITRARAFGMPVIAWSRSLTPERAEELDVTFAADPLEVARRSDVVSVHLALAPQTKGLCDAAFFAAMKPGAFFVNTSRAEVVDSAALRAALDAGLRAGLDVFDGEPAGREAAFEDAIAAHPNVVGTHHIGASTDEAQDAVAAEAARIVASFAATGEVPNCVNLAVRTSADHLLVVRHKDRVGVLAAVLDVLRRAGINVQEMENVIFAGGQAAVARISVHGAPGPDVLQQLSAHEDVFSASAVALPGTRGNA